MYGDGQVCDKCGAEMDGSVCYHCVVDRMEKLEAFVGQIKGLGEEAKRLLRETMLKKED